MTTRTCSTCRFWLGQFDLDAQEWPERAECRALPPNPSMGFPWTKAHDWCGLWDAHRATVEEMTGR